MNGFTFNYRYQRKLKYQGFSLLEVILAIAILGLAVPILGTLLSSAMHNSAATRDLSIAHRHAESIFSELASGIIPATATNAAPIEEGLDNNWVYDIEINDADVGYEGLMNVTVVVRQDIDEEDRPYKFTLTGWITDPKIEFAAEEATETDTNTEETESTDET